MEGENLNKTKKEILERFHNEKNEEDYKVAEAIRKRKLEKGSE